MNEGRRMKSQSPDNQVTRLALVVLIGMVISVIVPGCKDPRDGRKYYNQGVAHVEKGECDAAISDLTRAIKMRPGFAMAHFYRGRAYHRKGEHDKALPDLDKAIEIDPTFAVAYTERATIYFIKKEYDKVWEDVHKAESLGQEIREGFREALQKASGRKK
jgi:tetratricopeptide (TPR) repeat protein